MEKELLMKYIEGNCSTGEKEKVTLWLESSAENMKEFITLRKLYDISIWQTVSSGTQKKPEDRKLYRRKSVYIELLKIAAIFVIAFILFHYFFSVPKNTSKVSMQIMHVPAGQRAQITLSDGTEVWLNAKSTFTFPGQFTGKTREVKLDGEGFFEVTRDKSRPFIVNTGKFNVKVLGTAFNLLAYSESSDFETSLFEGSVEILKPGNSKGILLLPDERIYLEENRLIKDHITHSGYYLWKEGIISFEDETFTELIKKLELYFDLKIIVRNNDILNYRCTGKFRTTDGIEHILKVLQLSNHFTYTISEKLDNIVIQ